MHEVLETCGDVARKSHHVSIEEEAIVRFCRDLAHSHREVPPWDWRYHFQGREEETVAYVLVLDTLNFCFWPAEGKKRWEISCGPERLSGYYGLAASLKKAVEAGFPITNADYLADLSMNDLQENLAGEGEMQLMDMRLGGLRELGLVLGRHYWGKASLLVKAAKGSAAALARLLAGRLSSFDDVAGYEGRKVCFYKRAQIAAADLHGAFEGKGLGAFSDMDELTAFADYKLPQVLRHLGIIRYASFLEEKVDQKICLEPGSPEEVEIRANTVWAVELIRQELSRKGKRLRAFEIDRLLWDLGQDDRFREKPYHRTLTIYY